MLKLLTRRRRLTQANHAVEQWRAREHGKKLFATSSCLFTACSIRSSFCVQSQHTFPARLLNRVGLARFSCLSVNTVLVYCTKQICASTHQFKCFAIFYDTFSTELRILLSTCSPYVPLYSSTNCLRRRLDEDLNIVITTRRHYMTK